MAENRAMSLRKRYFFYEIVTIAKRTANSAHTIDD